MLTYENLLNESIAKMLLLKKFAYPKRRYLVEGQVDCMQTIQHQFEVSKDLCEIVVGQLQILQVGTLVQHRVSAKVEDLQRLRESRQLVVRDVQSSQTRQVLKLTAVHYLDLVEAQV